MALEKLNKLQQNVIKLIFFEGLTQEQTANRLGLNQRKVSRLLYHVLTKMRTYMT
ncbi:MAG: sigma-70 family RNA polymerase sigma factor [Bacillota bacterium]